MKKLTVTDVTLRELATQADGALGFRESLEVAKALDKLCVDTIGLPALVNEKADTMLVRTIASGLKDSVLSLPTGYTETSLQAAWNALSGAQKPQLCVSLPVSTVQMEYLCHMKAPKMQALAETLIKKARSLCDNVMFVAEDATRADAAFLKTIIATAADAGATGICVQDTAGVMLPDAFGEWVKDLKSGLPADLPLTVQCTDELMLATANALAAVRAGADGVAVVTKGKSAPTLLSVATVLAAKGVDLGYSLGIRVTELHRGLQQMDKIFSARSTKVLVVDNTANEADGPVLADGATESQVAAAVRALGYELTPEDMASVYEEFCRVAEKKTVNTRELEAIVANTSMQVPQTYRLVSFVINSGNLIPATAYVKFEKDGKELEGVSIGDGPIDAAFLAIEQIVGHHFELDDFQIQSVTRGREAMGSALVKIRENGSLYAGTGLSTDIIGASIRAYVNALNKIAFDAR